MRSVEWSSRAERDLEMIDDYWSSYSEASADGVLTRLEAASTFLARTPKAGPLLAETDARKWTVRGSPYILIYRIHPDRIEILRVHHGSENWLDPN